MALRDLVDPCEPVEVLGETYYLRYPVSDLQLSDVREEQDKMAAIPEDDGAKRTDAIVRIAAACVATCIRDNRSEVKPQISTDEAFVLLRRLAEANDNQILVKEEVARKAMCMCGLGQAVELLGKALDQSDTEESSGASED